MSGAKKSWGVLALALFLSACAQTPAAVTFPSLFVSCPDPEQRQLLTQGATYRDLAESRAEALAGWQRCFDVLDIQQSHEQR